MSRQEMKVAKSTVVFLIFFLTLAAKAAAADRAGSKVTISKQTYRRIISLAPSNTELVCSLNAQNNLIAVSEICDYPVAVQTKERVGNFSSAKMEKIAILKPDLILLVSGQESLENKLKKHGFKTLILDNSSVQNIGKNLQTIGETCSKSSEAKALAAAFATSIKELQSLTKSDKRSPRVFICVWPQPLMSAGRSSYMSEGLTIAGGINCTREFSQAYPRINPEKLLLLQADYILVPHEQAREKFWLKQPWTSLKAVKDNHLLVLPQRETDCLNRPTLRFVHALYFLALNLHPSLKSEIDSWYGKTRTALSL